MIEIESKFVSRKNRTCDGYILHEQIEYNLGCLS